MGEASAVHVRLEAIVRVAEEHARAPSETGALQLSKLLADLLAATTAPDAPESSVRLCSGDPIEALTNRERAVFDLIVGGLTNAAAARQLQISVKTVQTHRVKINGKLGVHGPGQLVRFAALRGLIAT